MVADRPYKREDWLREKYSDGGWTMDDIAEYCDVARGTVQYWMDKFEIERRDRWQHIAERERDYKNKEWLREKYIGEGRSAYEISHIANCDPETILRWLDTHGIERRTWRESISCLTTYFYTRKSGYEVVGDKEHEVLLHRLVAAAHFGIEEIQGKVVHHRNQIPWDNRPDNYEVMTQGEHVTRHAEIRQQRTKAAQANIGDYG